MTIKELREHYPNQWLGLQNVVYQEGDAGEFVSAKVIHTEDSKLSLVEWIADRNGTDWVAIWNTADTSAVPEFPRIVCCDQLKEKFAELLKDPAPIGFGFFHFVNSAERVDDESHPELNAPE
ncbi:MAG: hypothetical protein NC430_04245 [bacterium]|nr:hypothetical protein [bacterium]